VKSTGLGHTAVAVSMQIEHGPLDDIDLVGNGLDIFFFVVRYLLNVGTVFNVGPAGEIFSIGRLANFVVGSSIRSVRVRVHFTVGLWGKWGRSYSNDQKDRPRLYNNTSQD